MSETSSTLEFADDQISPIKVKSINNRILKLEKEVQTLKTIIMSKQTLEASSPDAEVGEISPDITLDEAKKEIFDYLNAREHANTSDIVFDLRIHPKIVIKALNALEEEKLIEENTTPKSKTN